MTTDCIGKIVSSDLSYRRLPKCQGTSTNIKHRSSYDTDREHYYGHYTGSDSSLIGRVDSETPLQSMAYILAPEL